MCLQYKSWDEPKYEPPKSELVICKLCGEEYWSDKRCSCSEIIRVKKMCLNCEFYNEITNKCSNEKVKETYFKDSPFEPTEIMIKVQTNKCRYWEVDYTTLGRYVFREEK